MCQIVEFSFGGNNKTQRMMMEEPAVYRVNKVQGQIQNQSNRDFPLTTRDQSRNTKKTNLTSPINTTS